MTSYAFNYVIYKLKHLIYKNLMTHCTYNQILKGTYSMSYIPTWHTLIGEALAQNRESFSDIVFSDIDTDQMCLPCDDLNIKYQGFTIHTKRYTYSPNYGEVISCTSMVKSN